MTEVHLWCDGSGTSLGNPGGWGTILLYGDAERELTGGSVDTTNNRMELTACIQGFYPLTRACFVVVHSDSEYVIKGMRERWYERWQRKNWYGVKNPDLWQELIRVSACHDVRWEWVKGHAKIRLNERCDKLARTSRQYVEQALKQGAPMWTLDIEVEGIPDGQLEMDAALDHALAD